MAKYAIDLETLDATVIRLDAFIQYMEEKLDTLDRRVAYLQDSWSGDAADAQSAAYTDWTAGARQMREGLATMREAARTAHSSYQSAVAANLRMFGA